MGTPVPPAPPDIEDAKWYRVTVNKYFQPGGAGDCSDNFIGRESCCERGDFIKAWYAGGGECRHFHPLCGLAFALHLVYLGGPWDTRLECREHLW
ncbi:hypothetical protein ES703_74992 [subsurface metagenome]